MVNIQGKSLITIILKKMRNIIIKTVFILFVGASLSFTTKQYKFTNPIKTLATFQGYDEYGFTFSFINEEGDEDVVTFETISDKILKMYNLKDNKFLEEEFEIIYEYKKSDDDIEEPILQSIKKVK
ncbi:hypothetical protein KUL156_35140 [Alteromonas sp. KUL156]|nr:hypothetical protein BACT7_02160 [Tenacibaculum mesophilum]GFD73953.1 hypothetical protein KUL113_33730 [Tenacibaculum sp. KUL113]GFD80890.1 hypothetical protein KUL118_37520 [Tenacibaculum sp. KUL118]GFD92140.1 hypothetical protein KUL154_08730 [Alteromonas sp. KUL154]GFE00922.1 hypothetical protein KUL156_35140 [Alteromonas sp. KUL156]